MPEFLYCYFYSMKFDICVGNPPYGGKKKGSSDFLHYMIMRTVLDFCTDKLCFIMPSKPIVRQLKEPWYSMFKNAVCTDIAVVNKSMFPNTKMDNTAIYYCDRTIPENDVDEKYCKKLDVENAIYNAIDDEAHKLFIDGMNRFLSKKGNNHISNMSYKLDKNNTLEKQMKIIISKMTDDGYYLNVNQAGIKPEQKGETQWISDVLEKIGVLTKDEEIKFCNEHTKRKNIIRCPNKKSGENLKQLMINGKVLRYSLWLTQTTQDILLKEFKYVPDIDYSEINSDEKLLSACEFTNDEIKKIMTYLNDFNFNRNRNDVVRESEVDSDSSLSGSEPSKTVLDN